MTGGRQEGASKRQKTEAELALTAVFDVSSLLDLNFVFGSLFERAHRRRDSNRFFEKF